MTNFFFWIEETSYFIFTNFASRNTVMVLRVMTVLQELYIMYPLDFSTYFGICTNLTWFEHLVLGSNQLFCYKQPQLPHKHYTNQKWSIYVDSKKASCFLKIRILTHSVKSVRVSRISIRISNFRSKIVEFSIKNCRTFDLNCGSPFSLTVWRRVDQDPFSGNCLEKCKSLYFIIFLAARCLKSRCARQNL